MRKLPKKPDKLAAVTKFHGGLWRVTSIVVMKTSTKEAGGKEGRVLVQIWYDGKPVFEAHGHTALNNALESVRHWSNSHYTPKFTDPVLADYTTDAQRSKAALAGAMGISKPAFKAPGE